MARKAFDVCATDDLEPGTMRAVDLDGTAVVLMRSVTGEYFALRNGCSHMGALLSDGRLQAKMETDDERGYAVSATQEVVRCPWHGYEFDVRSGRCAGDPTAVRVKAFTVTTRDGRVIIER